MINRIARTGTYRAILTYALISCSAFAADFSTISGIETHDSDRWSASGGSTSLRFDPGLLEELQLSVRGPSGAAAPGLEGEFEFRIQDESALDVWAPHAAFDGFAAGELVHSGRLTLEWPGGRLVVEGFSLRAAAPDVLELVDTTGNALFRLDYIHTLLYPEQRRMRLWNMDVSLTPWLAQQMGYPDLAGMAIASAFTSTSLEIPVGAETEGACAGPNWDNGSTFQTDVVLTAISNIQTMAREPGVRVVVASDAQLQNVGTADVPWYAKFHTEPGEIYPEPYSRDQHPFLVWAMYRVVDDIPQQIGQSAVKHAFATINQTCGCPSGNILWSAGSSMTGQGCTDVYSRSTNDNPRNLGIREEIPAFTGAFEQCGSMFAPGASPPGPCTQTVTGDTADEFERRLVVEESELETENATYYFESWYVIRDDVNIFNTMAHKSVTPTFGSTWTFPAGTHTLGPAIDAWVPPGTHVADQAHIVESTSKGHYSLAVKVMDIGGGNYRYVYALMNYDFDPKFRTFSLQVPEGVTPGNLDFLDGDDDGANDWTSMTTGGRLTWTAPAGAELEWGFMATFLFEANQAPVEGVVRLTADEEPLSFTPLVLGLTDTFHQNGFED